MGFFLIVEVEVSGGIYLWMELKYNFIKESFWYGKFCIVFDGIC